MPDLEIPKGQTYPAILGRATDQRGPLPLIDADEIELILNESAGGTGLSAPVTGLDPNAPGAPTFMLDGELVTANWQADIPVSLSDEETAWDKGKMKIVWDAAATPPLVQFVPQTGWITITVGPNVQEPA